MLLQHLKVFMWLEPTQTSTWFHYKVAVQTPAHSTDFSQFARPYSASSFTHSLTQHYQLSISVPFNRRSLGLCTLHLYKHVSAYDYTESTGKRQDKLSRLPNTIPSSTSDPSVFNVELCKHSGLS